MPGGNRGVGNHGGKNFCSRCSHLRTPTEKSGTTRKQRTDLSLWDRSVTLLFLLRRKGGYMELTDREWKAFRIEDIFECTKGIYLPTEKVVEGNIPFITAKVGNNGLNRFIGNGILFHGNRITIEKIRLSAYYQPIGFYCSHDVSVIWNKHINKYNALFITTMIMRNSDKYSYGRQAQLNVVKREYIMLPVTDDGQPDYVFMEQFIKDMMLKKYFQYDEFQKVRNRQYE